MDKVKFFEGIKNSFVGLVKPVTHINSVRLGGGWMFLMVLVLSIFATIMFMTNVGGFEEEIDEMVKEIPQFSYKNGELNVDKQLMQSSDSNSENMLIYLDTDIDDSIISIDKLKGLAEAQGATQAVFIGRTKMIVMQYARIQEMKYTDMFPPDLEVDNSNVGLVLSSIFKIMFTIIAICAVPVYIAIYYFSCLFYGLIGLIIASTQKSNLKFGEIYKITFSVGFAVWIIEAGLMALCPSSVDTIINWLAKAAVVAYLFIALYQNRQEELNMQFSTSYGMNGYNQPPMGGNYGNPPMNQGYNQQPMGQDYSQQPMGQGYNQPPMGGYDQQSTNQGYGSQTSQTDSYNSYSDDNNRY